MTKPRFRLNNGQIVPVQVARLPQPMDTSPWAKGSGPRVWTLEKRTELAAANAILRRERK